VLMPSTLIVGLGGTTRPQSSTERVVKLVLSELQRMGAEVVQLTGTDLLVDFYDPQSTQRSDGAKRIVDLLRRADGLVLSSPGYHGGISGLVKNALDYAEDLSQEPEPYLQGRVVGCVGTGAGWQGANSALVALRSVVHALRGWPTPLGLTVNTSEALFDSAGTCKSEALLSQVRAMADQILSFTTKEWRKRIA
jgi:FMN reductase